MVKKRYRIPWFLDDILFCDHAEKGRFKPLDEQNLFHLITIKREELYHLSTDVEDLTDYKIVAISQELDSLIAEYQKGLTNHK